MYAYSWLVSHVTNHVTITLLLTADTTNQWNEDDENADQSYGSRSRNGNRALQQARRRCVLPGVDQHHFAA